jgi:inorganic pyrophosphatase
VTLDELDWATLEGQIATNGLVIDRPRFSRHPRFPEIVYPIDYGYLQGVMGLDGDELDVFVGTAGTGLVGAYHTVDHRKGDEEIKLLYNCTPVEVYLVHGFLNFAPAHMIGTLRLRRDMATLWQAVGV